MHNHLHTAVARRQHSHARIRPSPDHPLHRRHESQPFERRTRT